MCTKRSVTISVLVVLASGILSVSSAIATPIPPDSVKATKEDPIWDLWEKGPVNAPVTVWLTNNGERIKNSDGKEVTYSKTILPPSDKVRFTLPGIANGKKVTDAEQKTGKPGDPEDPGTLYFSVFDSSRVMTDKSLSNWLLSHGYVGDTQIFMPDFFIVGGTELYYGVNWEELGTAGETFVNNYIFGKRFSIDSFGAVPELSMYTFSSTPLNYVAGTGWSGTPLPSNTQVEYVAFHSANAVPEPGSLALVAVGLVSFFSVMRKSGKPANSQQYK